MHAYLPAIGFGQIKKKSQLQQLLSSVQNFPDQVQKIRLDEESSLVVYTKEVAPDIGLMICGEEDMQGSFQMEYYEPYINSNVCSSKAECSIEKESAREAYDGVCDDCRLGLNLKISGTAGIFSNGDRCLSFCFVYAGKNFTSHFEETRGCSYCKEKGTGTSETD